MNIPFLTADLDPATGERGEWRQMAGDPRVLEAQGTHSLIVINRGDPKREVWFALPKRVIGMCRQGPGEQREAMEDATSQSWCVGHQCAGLPAWNGDGTGA